MRARTVLGVVAAAFAFMSFSGPAAAGGHTNPYDYGIYSPLDGSGRVLRYDPRSWYYREPGYYPSHGTRYWVPRAQMRYRYRYLYYTPRYRYAPAWGYPQPGYNSDCCRWGW